MVLWWHISNFGIAAVRVQCVNASYGVVLPNISHHSVCLSASCNYVKCVLPSDEKQFSVCQHSETKPVLHCEIQLQNWRNNLQCRICLMVAKLSLFPLRAPSFRRSLSLTHTHLKLPIGQKFCCFVIKFGKHTVL